MDEITDMERILSAKGHFVSVKKRLQPNRYSAIKNFQRQCPTPAECPDCGELNCEKNH